MKRLKEYYINDGLNGIILAKSLKQAIKMLAPYYGYKPHEILDDIKKPQSCDFELTEVIHMAKKGTFKKSRIIGWCEF